MTRSGVLLTICLVAAAICKAQTPAAGGVRLTFTLERTGAAAAHYLVQLDGATGKGIYRSLAVASPSGPGFGGTQAPPPEVPIAVPASVLHQAFAAAPLVRSGRCDAHRKNIAQTGTKILQLVQNDATSECSYNYSAEDRVNGATTAFEAIAETMAYGDRLQSKLRFDRLGLDAEMDSLQAAVKDGRAVAVGNIAPVLRRISGDDRVMERVQRKADLLLQNVSAATDASTAESR